jgi:hypothetical protein
MSYGYNYQFKINHPNLSNNIAPMRSAGFQPLFYFGGSQTPVNLDLSPNMFDGSHESFSESKQVDANKLIRMQLKKRSPVHVIPNGVKIGVQKY